MNSQLTLLPEPMTLPPAAARLSRVTSRSAQSPASPLRPQRLPIAVGLDVTLVSIDTVRVVKGGLDAESVMALVDAGRFTWVWDLATAGAARRELRFLAAEVLREERVAEEADAIRIALGGTTQRAAFRTAEIEGRWVVSNQALARFGRSGELRVTMHGRVKWIARDSLVSFLQRRRLS